METVSVQLTVYFDDPFWVGVLERQTGTRLEAARMVFGAEPKDYEVYQFLLEHYTDFRFSPATEADRLPEPPANPKRRQREAGNRIASKGTGTKAQQALNLLREADKLARKASGKQIRDAETERKFELRQEKRKQKHRGR